MKRARGHLRMPGQVSSRRCWLWRARSVPGEEVAWRPLVRRHHLHRWLTDGLTRPKHEPAHSSHIRTRHSGWRRSFTEAQTPPPMAGVSPRLRFFQKSEGAQLGNRETSGSEKVLCRVRRRLASSSHSLARSSLTPAPDVNKHAPSARRCPSAASPPRLLFGSHSYFPCRAEKCSSQVERKIKGGSWTTHNNRATLLACFNFVYLADADIVSKQSRWGKQTSPAGSYGYLFLYFVLFNG